VPLKGKNILNSEIDKVMSEENNNRTKWLHLRLKPEEYDKLHKHFSKTTCRKISDYARKVLLDKPIVTTVRNKSLDDLMAEIIVLKSELNSIGNNLNQTVKKLHTLHQIPDFKGWILTYETDEKLLLKTTEEIKNCILKITEKWLQ